MTSPPSPPDTVTLSQGSVAVLLQHGLIHIPVAHTMQLHSGGKNQNDIAKIFQFARDFSKSSPKLYRTGCCKDTQRCPSFDGSCTSQNVAALKWHCYAPHPTGEGISQPLRHIRSPSRTLRSCISPQPGGGDCWPRNTASPAPAIDALQSGGQPPIA